MKITFVAALVCMQSMLAYPAIIPANRITDWSVCGLQNKISDPSKVMNILHYGGVDDGVSSNNDALEIMMELVEPGDSAIIFFPQGTFFFDRAINLKSNIILRGTSTEETQLSFNLVNEDHAIRLFGNAELWHSQITKDAFKPDTFIIIQNPWLFSKNDLVYLVDNDSALVYSLYAYQCTGQLLTVAGINGDTLYFSSPLRRNYLTTKGAAITKINPVKNVGIEQLTLRRLDETPKQTNNIHFEYAQNCWVKCIESYNCNYGHLTIRYSSNIEVSGNYFQDAFSYGTGGHGYGTVIQFGSGECYIYNNIFKHLRHSMILGLGANGNVISYNYSINPYWTGSFWLPSNSAGDLVLHGDYPYLNLMEGNIVQNVVIDNSHGENGKFNTYFRNRAELYGFFMNFIGAGDSMNFIGNEITNETLIYGTYTLAGKGHYEYGNNIVGNISPENTSYLPDTSLYLNAMPFYFWSHSKWPPIGTPNPINKFDIEARNNYLIGKHTKCSNVLVYTGTPENTAVANMRLYPVPTTGTLCLQTNIPTEKIVSIKIMSLNGVVLKSFGSTKTFDIADFFEGTYLVQVLCTNKTSQVMAVKKVR